MTPKQDRLYWGLWKAAMADQGWDRLPRSEQEVKRKEVHTKVLGHPKSMKVLTNQDFDRVKAAFEALANGLQGIHELDHPEDGQRRRVIWKIQHDCFPRLALYVQAPESYVAELLQERFKVFAGLSDWTLLPHGPVHKEDDRGRLVRWPNPLQQFLMTLDARIDAFRRKAGHTVHDMRTLSGLECDCRACCRDRFLASLSPEEQSQIADGVNRRQELLRTGEVVQTSANSPVFPAAP